VPGDDGPPPYEVLAGLVASLRGELADALTALEQARAELAQARERMAELEARLRQTPRNSSRPPSSQGLDKPPRPSRAVAGGAGPGWPGGRSPEWSAARSSTCPKSQSQ
jgi:transposase